MPKSAKLMLLAGALALLVLAAACAPAAAPTPVPSTPVPPTPLPPPPTAVTAPTSVPPPAVKSAPTSAATTAPAAATAAEVTGQQLFALACASCHGQNQQGSKFTSDGQTISVPSLSWADLSKMYTTKPDRGSVEQQVALAITQGQDEQGEAMNEMMPHWSSLSQSQVSSLTEYLKNGGTASGETASLSGTATQLQGEQLFQTSCAACHGANGQGSKFTRNGQSISVPSLSWADLSKMYATKPDRGSVEQQVALAITQGQDEQGEAMNEMMPHWSFLSQPQVDSLIQYIKTAFQ
jgi:mono/diheme cytochrome c family protein